MNRLNHFSRNTALKNPEKLKDYPYHELSLFLNLGPQELRDRIIRRERGPFQLLESRLPKLEPSPPRFPLLDHPSVFLAVEVVLAHRLLVHLLEVVSERQAFLHEAWHRTLLADDPWKGLIESHSPFDLFPSKI